jgi:hypothetical protein
VTGLARARNFGIVIGDWVREMEGGMLWYSTCGTVWLCGGGVCLWTLIVDGRYVDVRVCMYVANNRSVSYNGSRARTHTYQPTTLTRDANNMFYARSARSLAQKENTHIHTHTHTPILHVSA